jgi:hypothetical protein
MRIVCALILISAAFSLSGCGSDRKFNSLSSSGSIAKINKDYDNRHETERKRREEREKQARKPSDRATRPDDASQFPDQRTEDQQFIEK